MIDNEYFKNKLIKLRSETEKALAKAEEDTAPVELDQTMIGRISRMDAMQQREMFLAAERSRKNLLSLIDIALKKLESGDYGFCSRCGEEIEFKRLDLNPTVFTCIDCAKN